MEETSVELEDQNPDAEVEQKEAVDPGQLEGKPKIDPRDTHPPEGSKRWKEIYRKAKEAERLKEEFETLKKELGSVKEQIKLVDALRQHNAELVKAIQTSSSTNDRDEVSGLEEQLKELRAKRIEAREKLDFKQVDALEDEIDSLKDKIRDAKRASKAKKAEETTDSKGTQFPEGMVEAFNNFVRETPWMSDPVMRGAAYAVDNTLAQDPKWQNAPYSERFAEVKRIVEERFKWNEGKGSDAEGDMSNVDPVESSGNRVSVSKGKAVVKLTSEQLEIARGLGITPEEMAKQVLAIRKSKAERRRA